MSCLYYDDNEISIYEIEEISTKIPDYILIPLSEVKDPNMVNMIRDYEEGMVRM